MGGHEKATKRTAGELDRVLQGWLDEHKLRRKLRDETGESDGEQAFMDVMLSVLEDKEKKSTLMLLTRSTNLPARYSPITLSLCRFAFFKRN